LQNPPAGYTRVCPYLLYEDARNAVEYLTTTFGFVQRLEQMGGAGRMHMEVVLGEDGLVYARVRAAGADVTELETAPVGDRRFTATDPEGQVWVFAQRVG
jgi:uncharacterized glyoxalase superfamily protein PhnB